MAAEKKAHTKTAPVYAVNKLEGRVRERCNIIYLCRATYICISIEESTKIETWNL